MWFQAPVLLVFCVALARSGKNCCLFSVRWAWSWLTIRVSSAECSWTFSLVLVKQVQSGFGVNEDKQCLQKCHSAFCSWPTSSYITNRCVWGHCPVGKYKMVPLRANQMGQHVAVKCCCSHIGTIDKIIVCWQNPPTQICSVISLWVCLVCFIRWDHFFLGKTSAFFLFFSSRKLHDFSVWHLNGLMQMFF